MCCWMPVLGAWPGTRADGASELDGRVASAVEGDFGMRGNRILTSQNDPISNIETIVLRSCDS